MRAGIMINGRTRLHVVANGTMTGQRYIDEVLLPHVRLSVVLSMLWGGKLLVETILRQTRTPLIRALTEEWDKLPQKLMDNVVQSMVRRVECLHHTPQWTYPVLIPFFKVPADF
ncbi:hypothetical protein TNCV_4084021 [Trichonephila clavipes]|nr:hypothetical protein TNCV_4084021 [Trichonephila clavipes]